MAAAGRSWCRPRSTCAGRVEEALEALDRYLGQASLAGAPQVTIIHGHGAGAMRDAVRTAREPSVGSGLAPRRRAVRVATARASPRSDPVGSALRGRLRGSAPPLPDLVSVPRSVPRMAPAWRRDDAHRLGREGRAAVGRGDGSCPGCRNTRSSNGRGRPDASARLARAISTGSASARLERRLDLRQVEEALGHRCPDAAVLPAGAGLLLDLHADLRVVDLRQLRAIDEDLAHRLARGGPSLRPVKASTVASLRPFGRVKSRMASHAMPPA